MPLTLVFAPSPLSSCRGRGLRSGTLPHFLCVGFGRACEVAQAEMPNDSAWVAHLSARLTAGIHKAIPDVTLNGDTDSR